MSKFIGVALSYSAATRVLTATVQMHGAVPELPAVILAHTRVENVTLLAGSQISASDVASITGALGRTLSEVNLDLVDWNAAVAVKDKADLLPAVPAIPDPAPPLIPMPPEVETATPE